MKTKQKTSGDLDFESEPGSNCWKCVSLTFKTKKKERIWILNQHLDPTIEKAYQWSLIYEKKGYWNLDLVHFLSATLFSFNDPFAVLQGIQ